MGVASHLHIRLDEYDERIRTFIPRYDELIAASAGALRAIESQTPHIVDLGTGTGALASKCLQVVPGARLTAIDEDAAILDLARQRLGASAAHASFVHGSFVDVDLPRSDAIVASLALHHIRTGHAKRAMYRKCRAALHAGGVLVSGDCCPSADPALATLERDAWRAHLRLAYTDEETDEFFAAWAEEDVYFRLPEELAMLRDAAFAPDVVWRFGPMAVIAARAD